MTIGTAAIYSSIQNTVLQPSAEDVPSLINIIGSHEAGKTPGNIEVPVVSTSAQNTGSVWGFGSMLHRLHIQVERGSDGQVPAYITAQAEVAGAAAAGEIDFTGSTGVLAGTLYLYVGFDLVRVSITDGMSIENIADAVVAAVNADTSLNFTAVKVAVTFEVTMTSKTIGTYGNAATGAQLAVNLESGQSTPTGVSVAFTQPTGGSGLPDIQDALDGMGTGDNKNELGFTALVHGYGQDSTTLEAIRDYVGPGDQLTGTYAKQIARPFVSATGEVAAGSSGLTNAIAFGNARKTDRANIIMSVPGSNSHPSEIGAQYFGITERLAISAAARGYTGHAFSRIHPGADADRWTNTEASKILAVNAGIGTTIVDGGVVKISDAVTLYHPGTVPENSNIYREHVNIRKIRNILANEKTTMGALTLQKSIIVEDINKISSALDRQYAIDIDTVKSTQIALINEFVKKGWLYEGNFAKANLVVTLRSATDGFDSVIKAILSGVNKISDNQVQADISTAVLN
jgi:phage tail sheath gpL-like